MPKTDGVGHHKHSNKSRYQRRLSDNNKVRKRIFPLLIVASIIYFVPVISLFVLLVYKAVRNTVKSKLAPKLIGVCIFSILLLVGLFFAAIFFGAAFSLLSKSPDKYKNYDLVSKDDNKIYLSNNANKSEGDKHILSIKKVNDNGSVSLDDVVESIKQEQCNSSENTDHQQDFRGQINEKASFKDMMAFRAVLSQKYSINYSSVVTALLISDPKEKYGLLGNTVYKFMPTPGTESQETFMPLFVIDPKGRADIGEVHFGDHYLNRYELQALIRDYAEHCHITTECWSGKSLANIVATIDPSNIPLDDKKRQAMNRLAMGHLSYNVPDIQITRYDRYGGELPIRHGCLSVFFIDEEGQVIDRDGNVCLIYKAIQYDQCIKEIHALIPDASEAQSVIQNFKAVFGEPGSQLVSLKGRYVTSEDIGRIMCAECLLKTNILQTLNKKPTATESTPQDKQDKQKNPSLGNFNSFSFNKRCRVSKILHDTGLNEIPESELPLFINSDDPERILAFKLLAQPLLPRSLSSGRPDFCKFEEPADTTEEVDSSWLSIKYRDCEMYKPDINDNWKYECISSEAGLYYVYNKIRTERKRIISMQDKILGSHGGDISQLSHSIDNNPESCTFDDKCEYSENFALYVMIHIKAEAWSTIVSQSSNRELVAKYERDRKNETLHCEDGVRSNIFTLSSGNLQSAEDWTSLKYNREYKLGDKPIIDCKLMAKDLAKLINKHPDAFTMTDDCELCPIFRGAVIPLLDPEVWNKLVLGKENQAEDEAKRYALIQFYLKGKRKQASLKNAAYTEGRLDGKSRPQEVSVDYTQFNNQYSGPMQYVQISSMNGSMLDVFFVAQGLEYGDTLDIVNGAYVVHRKGKKEDDSKTEKLQYVMSVARDESMLPVVQKRKMTASMVDPNAHALRGMRCMSATDFQSILRDCDERYVIVKSYKHMAYKDAVRDAFINSDITRRRSILSSSLEYKSIQEKEFQMRVLTDSDQNPAASVGCATAPASLGIVATKNEQRYMLRKTEQYGFPWRINVFCIDKYGNENKDPLFLLSSLDASRPLPHLGLNEHSHFSVGMNISAQEMLNLACGLSSPYLCFDQSPDIAKVFKCDPKLVPPISLSAYEYYSSLTTEITSEDDLCVLMRDHLGCKDNEFMSSRRHRANEVGSVLTKQERGLIALNQDNPDMKLYIRRYPYFNAYNATGSQFTLYVNDAIVGHLKFVGWLQNDLQGALGNKGLTKQEFQDFLSYLSECSSDTMSESAQAGKQYFLEIFGSLNRFSNTKASFRRVRIHLSDHTIITSAEMTTLCGKYNANIIHVLDFYTPGYMGASRSSDDDYNHEFGCALPIGLNTSIAPTNQGFFKWDNKIILHSCFTTNAEGKSVRQFQIKVGDKEILTFRVALAINGEYSNNTDIGKLMWHNDVEITAQDVFGIVLSAIELDEHDPKNSLYSLLPIDLFRKMRCNSEKVNQEVAGWKKRGIIIPRRGNNLCITDLKINQDAYERRFSALCCPEKFSDLGHQRFIELFLLHEFGVTVPEYQDCRTKYYASMLSFEDRHYCSVEFRAEYAQTKFTLQPHKNNTKKVEIAIDGLDTKLLLSFEEDVPGDDIFGDIVNKEVVWKLIVEYALCLKNRSYQGDSKEIINHVLNKELSEELPNIASIELLYADGSVKDYSEQNSHCWYEFCQSLYDFNTPDMDPVNACKVAAHVCIRRCNIEKIVASIEDHAADLNVKRDAEDQIAVSKAANDLLELPNVVGTYRAKMSLDDMVYTSIKSAEGMHNNVIRFTRYEKGVAYDVCDVVFAESLPAGIKESISMRDLLVLMAHELSPQMGESNDRIFIENRNLKKLLGFGKDEKVSNIHQVLCEEGQPTVTDLVGMDSADYDRYKKKISTAIMIHSGHEYYDSHLELKVINVKECGDNVSQGPLRLAIVRVNDNTKSISEVLFYINPVPGTIQIKTDAKPVIIDKKDIINMMALRTDTGTPPIESKQVEEIMSNFYDGCSAFTCSRSASHMHPIHNVLPSKFGLSKAELKEIDARTNAHRVFCSITNNDEVYVEIVDGELRIFEEKEGKESQLMKIRVIQGYKDMNFPEDFGDGNKKKSIPKALLVDLFAQCSDECEKYRPGASYPNSEALRRLFGCEDEVMLPSFVIDEVDNSIMKEFSDVIASRQAAYRANNISLQDVARSSTRGNIKVKVSSGHLGKVMNFYCKDENDHRCFSFKIIVDCQPNIAQEYKVDRNGFWNILTGKVNVGLLNKLFLEFCNNTTSKFKIVSLEHKTADNASNWVKSTEELFEQGVINFYGEDGLVHFEQNNVKLAQNINIEICTESGLVKESCLSKPQGILKDTQRQTEVKKQARFSDEPPQSGTFDSIKPVPHSMDSQIIGLAITALNVQKERDKQAEVYDPGTEPPPELTCYSQ